MTNDLPTIKKRILVNLQMGIMPSFTVTIEDSNRGILLKEELKPSLETVWHEVHYFHLDVSIWNRPTLFGEETKQLITQHSARANRFSNKLKKLINQFGDRFSNQAAQTETNDKKIILIFDGLDILLKHYNGPQLEYFMRTILDVSQSTCFGVLVAHDRSTIKELFFDQRRPFYLFGDSFDF